MEVIYGGFRNDRTEQAGRGERSRSRAESRSLRREERIYFQQTEGDCGKTNDKLSSKLVYASRVKTAGCKGHRSSVFDRNALFSAVILVIFFDFIGLVLLIRLNFGFVKLRVDQII